MYTAALLDCVQAVLALIYSTFKGNRPVGSVALGSTWWGAEPNLWQRCCSASISFFSVPSIHSLCWVFLAFVSHKAECSNLCSDVWCPDHVACLLQLVNLQTVWSSLHCSEGHISFICQLFLCTTVTSLHLYKSFLNLPQECRSWLFLLILVRLLLSDVFFLSN